MLKQLLIICMVLQCTCLFGQWKTLGSNEYPGDPSDMIFTVHALNEDVVWGLLFKPATFNPTQTYFKTIDGGATVTTHEFEVEDNSLTAFSIHALDENTAWVAMSSEPCQCYGQVYKTEDGGVTWEKKFEENTEQALLGIYFWDANEGFAIGSNGTGAATDQSVFYRTFDGGDSWMETTSALIQPGEGQWIASGNSSFDVTGDRVAYGTRSGRVFTSNDRGMTWEASLELDNNTTISSIAFQDEMNGIAISATNSSGFPGTNKAWKTEDGGLTWSALDIPYYVDALTIKHIPETNGTYVITGGWANSKDMLMTKSDGLHWSRLPAPRLIGISFLSPTVAFGGSYISNEGEGGLQKLVSSFEVDHANVTTIVGNRLEGFDINIFNPLRSNLYNPKGMAMDEVGNLYIANDFGNNILKLSADGTTLINIAGTPGFPNDIEVDPLTDDSFDRPVDIAIDNDGDLYIADARNNKIKKISFSSGTAVVSTYAGTGEQGSEDGSLESALFSRPLSLCFDSNNNLLVAEAYAIRKISPDGMVTTLAGSGMPGDVNGVGSAAYFDFIFAMDIDDEDNLYVTDFDNSKVRKIDPVGEVTTLAGTGAQGYLDGPGSTARFYYPEGIAVDANNNVFVGDGMNGFIRKIDSQGNVTSVVGTQHFEYIGPGDVGPNIVDGDGANAVFSRSRALFIDPNGDLLHTEWGSDVVRKIEFGVPSLPISVTKTIYDSQDQNISHIDHLNSYSFLGEIKNTSTDLVEEVQLNVKIRLGTSLQYSETISLEEIAMGETGFAIIEQTFTPSQSGTYDVEFNYIVDNEELISINDVIIVSDSIMGYDDYYPYLWGSYDFIQGWDNGFGMAYQLSQPDTITGIEFFTQMPAASSIKFTVFELLGTQLGAVIYESGPVIFEEDFLGTFRYQIPPLPVGSGSYLFAIEGLDEPLTIGFDNDHLSNQLWMFYQGQWGRVETLQNGYVELAGMIRPVLGTVPISVNIEEEEISDVTIQAYPNPFVNSISIIQNKPQQVLVSLIDVQGKILLEKVSNEAEIQFNNLTYLPTAAYRIRIQGDDFIKDIPVVKK